MLPCNSRSYKISGDFVTCLFLKRAPSIAFWSHSLVLLIFSSFPSVLFFVIPNTWSWSISLSLHPPIPKKGSAKECLRYRTIALISHASKVMLKILQARLQQYVNRELPDVQARFRKGRGIRDQIANIHWIMENKGKQRRECLQLSAPPSSQEWSPPLPPDLDAWSPILSLRFPCCPPSTCSPVATPPHLVKDSNSLIISSLSYLIYFFLSTGSFPSAHKHAQRPPENKRKTQRKACFDPAFPSSAESPTDLLPFPSRFFQSGPLSLTPCSPLKLLESGVDSRQMLKSRGSSALSPLGSEPHPQSTSCRFLFSALLFGNHASLSFLRPLGWLFLIPLEWVSTVSLTHNISVFPALVPCSPSSIQPLGEHLQACTPPYRSMQRHLGAHPQLWPSATNPNSWIHNLLPTVTQWVSKSHLERKTELFIFAVIPRFSTLLLL